MKRDKIAVAKIGKAIGLRGELKLYLESDFDEQFHKGAIFWLANDEQVEIEQFHPEKSLVKFSNVNVREDASKLTNQHLFTSIDMTREQCTLHEGEFYWFDVIGLKVIENEKEIGTVDEIERIGNVDYMIVKTASYLVEEGLSKSFYIPYIPVYVTACKPDIGVVITEGALDLLEAS